MTLHLVRHGAAEHTDGRCIGWADAGLSEGGAEALRWLAGTWSGPPPARLVSSDLARAAASAAVLAQTWTKAPEIEDEIEQEKRLREMHFGRWEGQSWADIEAADGERLAAWMGDWVDAPTPEGECFADVAARVGAWLQDVREACAEKEHVVAVAHAGPIRAALCHALQAPLARAFHLHVDHARVSTLVTARDGWGVRGVNAAAFDRAPVPEPR